VPQTLSLISADSSSRLRRTNNTEVRLCSGLLDQSTIQSINSRISGYLLRAHAIGYSESMGFQWADSFATLPITGGWMGYPCDWMKLTLIV